jgi:hypothetical protein
MKKKTTKLSKKDFIVHESIFNRAVYVFINWTHSEFAKFAREKGATDYQDDPNYDNNFSAFSTQITVKDCPDQWVICIKKFDWSIQDQGTLIHEIVHTIIKIWKYNNIPFTPDNQEFLAHAVGNLYEDICHEIFKVKSKKYIK